MTNINSVFDETLDKITNSLNIQAESIYNLELEKARKSIKSKPLESQIEKLDLEYDSLTHELTKLSELEDGIRSKRTLVNDTISNLRKQIQEMDKLCTTEDKKQLDELESYKTRSFRFAPSQYQMRFSELSTMLKLEGCKQFKNLTNRYKISSKYRDMWSLAISNTQKQKIILELQNAIDWQGLGIDIPAYMQVQEIKVINGALIINNALPEPK